MGQQPEDDFWDEDDSDEEEDRPDPKTLKFTKIKDLALGATDVHVEGVIDFVGDIQGKGYGEEPYAVGYIKDDSGEIKVTFWGDETRKAKPKKKVKIYFCSVTEYRGQLQLSPNRKYGIEFK